MEELYIITESWAEHFLSYNRLFRFLDYMGLIYFALLFHYKKLADFKKKDFVIPTIFTFLLVYLLRFYGLMLIDRPLMNGFEFLILIIFVFAYLFSINKSISELAASILIVQFLWPIHYLVFYRLFAHIFSDVVRLNISWVIIETLYSYCLPAVLIVIIRRSVYIEAILDRLKKTSLFWRVLIQFFATIIMSSIIMANLTNQVVLIFTVILIILILSLVYWFEKMQQKEIEGKYLKEVEKRQTELRSFRHDHLNLLSSMMKFVADEDLDGLKIYLQNEIEPARLWLLGQDIEIGNLSNLKIKEVKSLLSSKLNQTSMANIELIVEIPEIVEEINMNTMLLVRVLGNLMDNAIEALENESKPVLHLAILEVTGKDEVVIVIKNTFTGSLSVKAIFEKGMTTKDDGSGLGLSIVKKIVSKLEHVTLLTQIDNFEFKQELTIKKR